ncbi:MAG: hypothetical protein U0U67_11700 [Chitinophagales bacterium]
MKHLYFIVFFLSFQFIKAQNITTDEWTKFVPSVSIPKNIKCRKSNNNVDLIQFNGKYYCAFRTAPTHFASKKVHLYIISSTDFKNWKFETEFFVKADMREPRFCIFQNKLHFYFFEGGYNIFKFEPKHIWTSILADSGWSEKIQTNLDGFVDWRFHEHDNKMYLSAYYGVNLYNSQHHANLRLFTSEDGINFQPISKEPQITEKGAEEGEFVFDKQGNVWSLVRLEGSGSLLCFASKDSIDKWKTKFSKFKYDSSLLFEQGDDLCLIARRHLKGEATPVQNPSKKQRRKNLLRYSFSKKVTALYKINKEKMEIETLMDFPSTGDTAFPAIAPIDSNSFYVLNYSSDIHKRSRIWFGGQLAKTYIYQTVLHFK